MATISVVPDKRPLPLELIDLQKTIAFRLLLVFAIPLIAITILGAYAYRISGRIKEVEVGTKLVNIERLLLKDKNYSWAIVEYEKIAAQYPSAPILIRLGDLYFRSDKAKAAIAVDTLESARRLDPESPETYQVLTYIYVSLDRAPDAVREGKKALQLNPNDANTYNNLAWLYATGQAREFRDLELAKTYAERAVELTRGKQASFVDTLAEVYFRLGGANRDHARELMRRVIDIAPRDEVEEFRRHFMEMFPGEKTEVNTNVIS